MNKEVRYDDVKQNNGQVTIRLLFDCRNYGGAYIPIYVKALKPTKSEINDYGSVDEFCRLNLTKWKMLGAPAEVLEHVEHLIGKTLWCYYNGAECSWKFFDPDGCIDKENKGLDVLKCDIRGADLDKLHKLKGAYYEPHCDSNQNYGDVNVHAVYDFMQPKA